MPSTSARRLFTLMLLFVLLLSSLGAAPAGLSFSTWMPSKSIGAGEGVHFSFGGFVAPHPRVELEVNAIMSLTPRVGEHLYGALHISTGIPAPFFYRSDEATFYYNALIGATLLGGYDLAHNRYTAAVGVRIVPFTLGGAYYKWRERAVEFSILYDLMERKWSVVWSLLGYDIYLRSSAT